MRSWSRGDKFASLIAARFKKKLLLTVGEIYILLKFYLTSSIQ